MARQSLPGGSASHGSARAGGSPAPPGDDLAPPLLPGRPRHSGSQRRPGRLPPSGRRRRLGAALKQVAWYVSAAVLPWMAYLLSMHSPVFRFTPSALGLAGVAVFANFCSVGPVLVAVLSCTLAFNRLVLSSPNGGWSLHATSLLRSSVLLSTGVLITVFSMRRRAMEQRLRVTLEALRENTEALRQAQQGSRTAAWVFNTGTRTTHWYEGGAEVFGRSPGELSALGSTVSLVFPEDRPRVAAAAEKTTRTGELFEVQFRAVLPDGGLRWLESRGAPLADEPMVWRGVTADITERKAAEAALIRSERLAAAGRLASTIAHEINNPLEAVTNLIYLAQGDERLSRETAQYLQHAEQELARLSSIARHTLGFVRQGAASGPVNVQDVVENVLALYRTRCETRGGRMRWTQSEQLQVAVPSGELRQILANLVSNASDALSGPESVVEVAVLADGREAVIEVRDNGSGIAPEHLERIFEPFFSTKDDVGTGIGLWVTRELVEKNGGRIEVASGELPGGYRTCFRVTFPLFMEEEVPA